MSPTPEDFRRMAHEATDLFTSLAETAVEEMVQGEVDVAELMRPMWDWWEQDEGSLSVVVSAAVSFMALRSVLSALPSSTVEDPEGKGRLTGIRYAADVAGWLDQGGSQEQLRDYIQSGMVSGQSLLDYANFAADRERWEAIEFVAATILTVAMTTLDRSEEILESMTDRRQQQTARWN